MKKWRIKCGYKWPLASASPTEWEGVVEAETLEEAQQLAHEEVMEQLCGDTNPFAVVEGEVEE